MQVHCEKKREHIGGGGKEVEEKRESEGWMEGETEGRKGGRRNKRKETESPQKK